MEQRRTRDIIIDYLLENKPRMLFADFREVYNDLSCVIILCWDFELNQLEASVHELQQDILLIVQNISMEDVKRDINQALERGHV